MPQLDLFSLGNQFFWGVIFFVVFYFLVTYYVVPSLFSILFARSFYSSKLSSDSVKLISICFLSTSVIAVCYSDAINCIQSSLDSIRDNQFAYDVALAELVLLELSEIYNNDYFNDDEK